MTYDGFTNRIYVNGTLDGTAIGGALHALANDGGNRLEIAGYSPSGTALFYHGALDEIRVSDVALIPGAGTGKNGELAWNATLVPEPSMLRFLSASLGLLFIRN